MPNNRIQTDTKSRRNFVLKKKAKGRLFCAADHRRYALKRKLMNIKEFSKISGITSYTLRYYEKIGIFQEISRNASGHRDFAEKDLLWAEFINRLKETGMPLEQIKKYALLRQQGESTANARKNLLEDHASVLRNKISEEKQHLSKINEKIEYYEKVILNKESS